MSHVKILLFVQNALYTMEAFALRKAFTDQKIEARQTQPHGCPSTSQTFQSQALLTAPLTRSCVCALRPGVREAECIARERVRVTIDQSLTFLLASVKTLH